MNCSGHDGRHDFLYVARYVQGHAGLGLNEYGRYFASATPGRNQLGSRGHSMFVRRKRRREIRIFFRDFRLHGSSQYFNSSPLHVVSLFGLGLTTGLNVHSRPYMLVSSV